MVAAEVTLGGLIEEATKVFAEQERLFREAEAALQVAKERLEKARAEKSRLETLARGTGQLLRVQVNIGARAAATVAAAFQQLQTRGIVPRTAVLVKQGEVTTWGNDLSNWGGVAYCYYVLPNQ